MSSAAKQRGLAPESNHKRVLAVASATATVATLILTVAAAQLPLFDSSPSIVLPPPEDGRFSLRHALASAVLRWDAFHFVPIAKEGYTYENQWAFFPGTPFVIRIVGKLVDAAFSFLGAHPAPGWEGILLGSMISPVLSVLSVLRLYDLSLVHLNSCNAAFLAALLSLLPSSPVTLRLAGYSEPFFTYLSYTGMLFCARRQWLFAACSFMAACTFRSNGIFLAGFILWGMLVEPILNRQKISIWRALHAFLLSALTISPFVYFQYSAFQIFCADADEPAPWCSAFLPSIYTYVQSKYWNGGFMRYWTVAQIPNFVFAAPPLTLLFGFTSYYLRAALLPRLLDSFLGYVPRTARISSPENNQSGRKVDLQVDDAQNRSRSGAPLTLTPFLNPSIAPHAIHALLMSLLLLFASHTQIVLRQAASMPVLYWAAAWLLVEHPAVGRWWVGWSVVWGAVSCVLWAAFLPPA
ncbi:glycosyltransferase family 76 protein [Polyporus arcularius HHB13444]|uniref:GPI mannosyltransferase 2 n=1 Tax=Polyporus arcularius HHB13444 TaxID=1314778 RepID=A0A5C3PA83_9APHY|nr:glycosyltransferase family 76 protein [Polyporus arcularius HHB13444]